MSIAKPAPSSVWAAATPANIIDPGGLKDTGWTAASAAPPYRWMNWILNKCDALASYLLARGIPDYDEAENYRVNDICQYIGDGKTYRALQANGPATAIKHPSDASYWQRWGHSDTELGTLLGLTGSGVGIAASSGTAADVEKTLVSIPSGPKIVSCHITGIAQQPGRYWQTVLTLSGASHMASDTASVQVTPEVSSLGGHATWFTGTVTGPNQVTVVLGNATTDGETINCSVTITGY